MSGEKPIIYLVDDHKSFTYLTKHVVNHYHNSICEIFEFSDSREALNAVLENPNKPDFLFLDLSMPKLDGWSFLEELKKGLNTKTFPFEIVIVSGSDSIQDYNSALVKEYVSHYISKPLDLNKIRQIFESNKFLMSYRRNNNKL